ncbi:MAG: hypothetical protein LBT54_01845 [Bifidobacteriaceae bacterium]|jgi:hypothetical protein|nr:hypothetical protein [Bifidobacteriaceae bacterium]
MRQWWRAAAAAAIALAPAVSAGLRESAESDALSAVAATGPADPSGLLAAVPALAVSLAVIVAFAIGWPRAAHIPVPATAALVIALVGAGGVALLAVTDQAQSAGSLVVVVGFGVLAAFGREVARADGRAKLIESVAATTTGIVVAAAFALWLPVVWMPHGLGLALGSGLAMAVGVVAAHLTARRLGRWAGLGALAVVAASVAGGMGGVLGAERALSWLGAFETPVPWQASAVLGLSVGLLLAALRPLLTSRDGHPAALSDLAIITLPLAIASVPAWILGLALT